MILRYVPYGRATLLFVIFVPSLFAVAADSQTDGAEDWLERMVMASKAISYEGTFVYHAGGSLQSMKVVNTVDSHGDQQRMYSLNGESRQVTRDGEEVTVTDPAFPAHASGFYDAPFPLALSRDFAKLHENYQLLVGDEGRIAGRQTRQIVVRARDGYRYGYQLWLDQETALLLRSDLLDTNARPLEQLMFTNLSFLPRDGCSAAAPVPRELVSSTRAVQPRRKEIVDQSRWNWQIRELPPGFVVTSRFTQDSVGGMDGTETALVSDGLATISVYVGRQQRRDDALQGLARFGAVNAFGIVEGDLQMLVVGDVPDTTVEQVARAVQVNRE
jgi:sigma-E factor negative regulatory protein RseB